MFLDEVLQRQRWSAADFVDDIIRAGKETVLVVDGDFSQVLNEKRISRARFRRRPVSPVA